MAEAKKSKQEDPLKKSAIEVLACNAQLDEVYVAKNGQCFSGEHDAREANFSIGFDGKEATPVKVARKGNEKAIDALAEKIEADHEKAVAKANKEAAERREAKKALAASIRDLNKG